MRAPRLAAVALAVLTLAACAEPGTRPLSGPPPTEAPGNPAAPPAAVPDVTGLSADVARSILVEAKLVPVIRYAPEVLVNAGSVMLSMPKAGARAAGGDVVVLVVAGQPDMIADDGRSPGLKALDELAAAREEIFVGIGFTGNDLRKPAVVALSPGVDPSVWQDRMEAAAGTQKFTVKVCANTRAELLLIQAELTGDERPDTPFGAALRPAECAIHIIGDLPAAEKAALKERYGTAVVVEARR